MKNKFSSFRIDNYLSKQSSLFIFSLLLLGVILAMFSGSLGMNLWEKLYLILTHSFFNIMVSFSVGVVVYQTSLKVSRNYNYILRYQKSSKMLLEHAKTIFVCTLYVYFIAVLLAFAGAIVFSAGNFSMASEAVYSIYPLDGSVLPILYDLFFIIRGFLFLPLLGVVFYFLLHMLRQKVLMVFVAIFALGYFIVPSISQVISHFWSLPLLYHYYFIRTEYISFGLELLCSILYLFVLLFIVRILFYLSLRKKRELL